MQQKQNNTYDKQIKYQQIQFSQQKQQYNQYLQQKQNIPVQPPNQREYQHIPQQKIAISHLTPKISEIQIPKQPKPPMMPQQSNISHPVNVPRPNQLPVQSNQIIPPNYLPPNIQKDKTADKSLQDITDRLKSQYFELQKFSQQQSQIAQRMPIGQTNININQPKKRGRKKKNPQLSDDGEHFEQQNPAVPQINQAMPQMNQTMRPIIFPYVNSQFPQNPTVFQQNAIPKPQIAYNLPQGYQNRSNSLPINPMPPKNNKH
ncbi:hypothetical protein TVAG_296990 [Trichomonas vaginalis G3]|uniref:Uncharacterized protein n=1 Tax=Trichomonas vaginalis (strain ATCC PRA-98 / G3) TaxID=412133 RepID=A2DR94_TRIV3|nr:hypothetical protein TVAGG3_0512540 [Trichomonas vaginalis G3]EAY17020.1 hypothetical protein TVAG_296990 [Trichomonas vaginalis G3]KAI5517883.1 hypothetical protein TVAGG3_0512540 [Trichomonas vaginalis G3]|eukprot:XP_001329243.1 hypothetical protein [Trichomonas vaginalis G3]